MATRKRGCSAELIHITETFMTKTTQQIAQDCGISEIGADRITELLTDDAPVQDGRIVVALYRRIEKLEEALEDKEANPTKWTLFDVAQVSKVLFLNDEAATKLVEVLSKK